MASTRTVKVTHPLDGYMVINEDEYTKNPSQYTLFEEGVEPPGGQEDEAFFIVGNVLGVTNYEEGVKHYWDGDYFQVEPSSKTYTSEATAKSAISSTGAIQSLIESGDVLDVRVEAV